jgi:integrase
MIRSLPRYVNAFTAKGRRYYYFRRPGAKTIRLPDFGTPEFEIAYQRALYADAPEVGVARTVAGTLNAAIVDYYKSKQTFGSLAPSTQAMHRSYLEKTRERYGKSRLPVPQTFIVQMMDRMTPFAARNWLKVMRALMKHAVASGKCKANPTEGVKLPKVNTGGFHTWTDDEAAQFEATHPLGSKARLAYALGIYTAQRREDVVLIGRQHFKNGVLMVRPIKTRTTTNITLAIPVHPALQATIDATPTGHMTLLTTKTGKSYSPNDFSDEMRVWCDRAGLSHCSFHGLRKAAARRLAEAGCTAHEIAAITGHASLKEVERYTRAVDQARLARSAMAKTVGEGTKRNGKLTNS